MLFLLLRSHDNSGIATELHVFRQQLLGPVHFYGEKIGKVFFIPVIGPVMDKFLEGYGGKLEQPFAADERFMDLLFKLQAAGA